MFPPIRIDKASDMPAYRQVIERITSLIKEGALKPGDRLPPERDLAESLGVARGTIKKAYEDLARNHVVDVNQGRGTFVSYRQDSVEPGRKERASRLIEDVLTELEGLRFSYREIKNLIDIKILEREERSEGLFIAAVDCNPESLAMYRRQLSFFSRLSIKPFLLDDLVKDSDPAKRLREFEIVFSTSTHFSELIGLVPGLKERIVQVVVSPSQETIINLAMIAANQRVGIVCESRQFMQIIRNKLKDFRIPAASVSHLFLGDGSGLAAFMADKDVVIAPSGYSFEVRREDRARIQEYTDRGGKVVYFDYRIERGSLLYLEERIKALLDT